MPDRTMEQGPDGSCSDLYDTCAAYMDEGKSPEATIDDLVLFIERKGLSDEAQLWLHGRADGAIKGRQPYVH